MQRHPVRGVELAVWRSGHGDRDLVFAHGFQNDHTVWRPLTERHDEDRYRFTAFGLAGCGASGNPGATDGGIWLRFQDLQTIPTSPIPVTTQVVNVADVKQYLPVDTPTVTPAQQAADLQERLFEWDYTHDQNENTGWLGANLEYNQIKAAVGPQEFSERFGGQSTQFGAPQEVPTVMDRMTDPSLIPNLTTILGDIKADPTGAVLTIKDNLSLAANDIEMPTVLAAGRLEVLVEQTAQISARFFKGSKRSSTRR
jgi:hypothetical protein